jgi:hypothetical protein
MVTSFDARIEPRTFRALSASRKSADYNEGLGDPTRASMGSSAACSNRHVGTRSNEARIP